jgi:hypothetical protein
MTDNSYSVIIQYNIPGVHYNETERCFNKNKKTLGVTFVENINGKCPDLEVDVKKGYSVCNGDVNHGGNKTGFDCRKSPPCPFKLAALSSLVIEFYLKSPKMKLIAVEVLDNLQNAIKDFLGQSGSQ